MIFINKYLIFILYLSNNLFLTPHQFFIDQKNHAKIHPDITIYHFIFHLLKFYQIDLLKFPQMIDLKNFLQIFNSPKFFSWD